VKNTGLLETIQPDVLMFSDPAFLGVESDERIIGIRVVEIDFFNFLLLKKIYTRKTGHILSSMK